MNVDRTVYVEADAAEPVKVLGGVGYTDLEGTREEVHRIAIASDNYQNWRIRTSPDDGASWSGFTPLDSVNVQREDGGIVTFPGPPYVDPATGICYRSIMKRLWPGLPIYTFDWSNHLHPFCDHVFVQENGPAVGDSHTGMTTATPEESDATADIPKDAGEPRFVELQYERFDARFDPDNPFAEPFLTHNRAYRGQSFCFDGRGGVFHPMVCQPEKYERGQTRGGVVLMRRERDGGWHPSNQRYVTPEVSSRGLLEPDAAILSDGRVLIVCRGSDTPTTEGRKWMTWSEDGGRTLAPVEEFRYASGKRFYSPSSIHRFFRSRKNGRLYWIGNISDDPPRGNDPRYPLVIGVIDEERMGLIEESIEVIDTRRDGEPDSLSLSNFYLLESRDSLDLELFMTRMARTDGWLGSVYRYVIPIG